MPKTTQVTPDATTTAKGKIQLAGDLAGTAASPQIAATAVGTAELADASVTPNKLGTGAASATVLTSETRNNTAYGDLTTTTDTVTVTIGNKGIALLSIACASQNAGTAYSLVGVDISGANTTAATDDMSIGIGGAPANTELLAGATFTLTGLNAGSTTFKMKYRTTAGVGTFKRRRISVVPL